MTFPFVRVLGLATLALSLSSGWARADLMFTMEESGLDVVLSVSGSIDTSKFTPIGQWFSKSVGAVSPSDGQIILGVGVDFGNRYALVKGADVFGSGGAMNASSFTGDAIDLHGIDEFIGLPPGYASGAQIATTMTFDGQTFETLGLTPGTYDWFFGDGQTVTLKIGADATVPEPSSVALLAVGGLVALTLNRRSRV